MGRHDAGYQYNLKYADEPPASSESVSRRLTIADKIISHIDKHPDSMEAYKDFLQLIKRIPTSSHDFNAGMQTVPLVKYVLKRAERASRTSDSMQFKSDLYDIRRDLYTYTAPFDFDCFMVAMEWNRDPKARFWLPRRRALEGRHKIATQMQEFIEGNSKFLGFSVAPGLGKSTLIKFLLAYVLGREPHAMNMYVSYSTGMINLMMDAVVSMLTSDEYRFAKIFPGMWEPLVSREFSTISYRKKGDFPSLGLVSLGASVTGRTRANRFMVTDDLVKNDEVARSPERLNKLWLDYTSTLTTRTIGDKVKQIMLGTSWSLYDPINRMEAEHEGDPDYKFIKIPVWNEQTEECYFDYDTPDSYTTESIRTVRANLEPYAFSALYLSRPLEKEGLAFKRDEMLRYNGVLPDCEPDRKVFVIDVAWGGGDSLSMPIAYVYGEEAYIVDWLFDRSDKSITEPRVVGKIIAHELRTGTVEANNGGEGYKDDIDKMLRDKSYRCSIKSKKAPGTMAKIEKIEQHAPTIRTFIFLDDDKQSDEYKAAFNELTSFSFTAKNLHDDAADSMAQLSDHLANGVKAASVGKRFM